MRDDVIIVDHDHRIVAVMPVGSSAGGGGTQGGSVSLSQSEIREAQMKLNQKGFNVGKPDGVMGPRTRDGLAQFQRQEGLPTLSASPMYRRQPAAHRGIVSR
jgi:peptidoglycan hydrolase-like protein with peptidoglycan-binding domain